MQISDEMIAFRNVFLRHEKALPDLKVAQEAVAAYVAALSLPVAKSFFADFQAIAFERARAETAESALATALSDNERLGRERDAILKRAQTAEQWLREANFLVREHKSACADAISQAQAAEAERDTLLAQVEKMRVGLQTLSQGLRGPFMGKFDAALLVDAMLSASPLGTPEGGAK